MTRITTDSSLLSLTGLLLEQDDPCLRAGAHLRWWMSPELGLPRTGFRLRRRPASQWPWLKHETLYAHFNKNTIATSVTGIHVRNAPLRIEKAVLTPAFSLRCERRRPMRFLYEQREQTDPLFQPFIRFAVILKCPSPSAIIVLRSFVKRDGADMMISEERVRFGSLPYYHRPDTPERAIFVSASEIHRVELEAPDNAEVLLVRFVTPELLHRLDDWEQIGIFLPLCEPNTPNVASPDDVRALAARRLASNRPRRRPGDPRSAGAGRLLSTRDHSEFEKALMNDAEHLSKSISRAFRMEMERPILPGKITLADVDEGQISGDDGVSEGSIDLPFHGVLQAGAFSPHIAAMLGLAHYDSSVRANQSYDYAVDALTPSMWLALGLLPPEVAENMKMPPIPKLDFGNYPDRKTDMDKRKGGSEGGIFKKGDQRPLPPIFKGRVVTPTIAAKVNQTQPTITAQVKLRQKDNRKTTESLIDAVKMATNPKVGSVRVTIPPKILERIRVPKFPGPVIRPPVTPPPVTPPPETPDLWEVEPGGYHRLIAFILNQEPAQHAMPVAPMASGQSLPDAGASPVQTRVALKSRPGTFGSRTLIWRKNSTNYSALGPIDPVTGLMIPALPAEDGYCRFMDEDVSTFGHVQYRAIDVDCFGRASRSSDVRVDIRDLVAPPSPSKPNINEGNPSTSGGTHFPSAELSTTWSTGMVDATPDLAAIRFMWRKGHHSADDVLASHDGENRIVWPSPTARQHQNGTDIYAKAALDLGRDGNRREISVICVAEDQSGNMSLPSSPAHLVLIDEIKIPSPVQPPEPQWTSWPDANGDCRWTVRWTQPGQAISARVSTASESRLLALSGTSRASHLALSHAERAERLKQLAIVTPNAFVPEELAYPIHIEKHDVVLSADSDDLRVVVVEFIGETGQKAPWPAQKDAFAVVRARSSAPAPVPRLSVKSEKTQDLITATSDADGLIEVFVLKSPEQVDLIDIMTPVITFNQGMAPFRQDRTAGERWFGYTARLRAADGRVSALTPILWRQQSSANN